MANDTGARRAGLIVNTHAKRGRKAFDEAKRLLESHGFAVEAHAVDDPARLGPAVSQAVEAGHPLVVLGGGDGTISSSAGAFAKRDTVLGILPLGTANSFARSLGIPLDLPGAVRTAAEGQVATVDLGRVGERYFTNVLSVGLQTAIAHAVNPTVKRVLGRGAYLAAALAQIGRFEAFGCRVTLDGRETRAFGSVLEVRIANGAFKGGMLMAPEAGLASGDLVVHVVKGRSWLTLGRAWATLSAGGRPDESVMESLRGARLRLETTPGQEVSVDGEVEARTPIEVSVEAGALKVMRGRDAAIGAGMAP